MKLLLDRRIQLRTTDRLAPDEPELRAITELVRTAVSYDVDRKHLLILMERYIPASVPRGIGARFGGRALSIARAYALRSALGGENLELLDLADADLRQKLTAKSSHHEPQELTEFKSVIEPLLPWLRLWADSVLNSDVRASLTNAIQAARKISAKARSSYYRENPQVTNEIARLWLELLILEPSADPDATREYEKWIGALEQPLWIPTSIDLVRLGGHDARLVRWSIAHAEETARRAATERSDAESKCTTLMQLASAIFHVSRSEARAYFNESLRITGKIGDENLDRWNALLDLALRARDIKSPSPRRAYLLSRCAELCYAYVARDKHFDWDATVEAIAGLCPSSCITILSRWRDRRFGRCGRLLPAAVEFLTENGLLDGRSAATLIAFRGEWRTSNLLRAALSGGSTKANKQHIAHVVMRVFILSGGNAKECSTLIELAEAEGISTAALRNDCEFAQVPASTSSYVAPRSVGAPNWDSFFSDLNLTLPDDIGAAHARFKAAGAPYDHKGFFETGWGHVKPGSEADFIRAVSENVAFNLYHFQYLLEAIPAALRNRLSLKNAVADASKRFARRCYSDVVRTRYYESFPFKLVKEISGIPESEIIRVVLGSLGESLQFGDPKRLFSLASLIGSTLVTPDATEALEFGLSLYEDALANEDGDGPWSQALLPPEDIEFALAGYIWAALAAPEAAKRWEAAHVVRLLCGFKRTEILGRVIELAQTERAAPFVDERLPFYSLHARQWLVIALARAAIDDAQPVAPHFEFIVALALRERPHILIRSFAAEAALSLIDSGFVGSNAPLRDELSEINKSWLPPRRSKIGASFDGERSINDDAGLSFWPDIGPYWFSGLARCFEIAQSEVECAARKLIMDEWGYSGKARWTEDPRTQRNIFDQMETHHSHGSYPRTDDLHFYLSYHAMMIVAGNLLSTIPLPISPGDDYDRFDEWVHRHGLTRTDGRWLADRRDPCPIHSPWRQSQEDKDWPWSLMRADFDQVLGIDSDRLTVWGHWTEVTDMREQSVSISSALVSRHRSAALLRALQTTMNPHDYRIPDADVEDQFQLDHGEYKLRGWIVERSDSLRLDEYDPWSGEISYPPIVPAEFVCEQMQLRSDAERRTFRQSGDLTEVLWSQVWGEAKTNRHEDAPRQRGRRLQANRGFVSRLLEQMDMDLIISVELERDLHGYRRSSRTSNSYEFIPKSARLFLLRATGDVVTI